jgi:hypothetical protein
MEDRMFNSSKCLKANFLPSLVYLLSAVVLLMLVGASPLRPSGGDVHVQRWNGRWMDIV